MNKITAIFLNFNTEELLTYNVFHIYDYVDEIIVANTGGSAGTVLSRLLKMSKIRLITLPREYLLDRANCGWSCDEAATRNYLTNQASNDWIVHIDTDEFLSIEFLNFIARSNLYHEAYSVERLHFESVNTMISFADKSFVCNFYNRNKGFTWLNYNHNYTHATLVLDEYRDNRGIPVSLRYLHIYKREKRLRINSTEIFNKELQRYHL